MLFVPSTHGTYFGRIEHPQTLNTLYIKLKLKYIYMYINFEMSQIVQGV